MKKQKLKNYFKTGILIFGISLLFQSCNRDEIIDYQELKNNNVIVEYVSFIELENNPLFSNILLNKTSKIDIYRSKPSNISKNSGSDYTILTDDISKAMYKDYEAYSFRISNPNQPLFTFDNFVIQKNHDGSIDEFILRYEYDQLEYVKSGIKKFFKISKFHTDYSFISSDNNNKESSKNNLTAKSNNCYVTTVMYHRIPDGREYIFKEGSVCQHPGDCTVIIEYTLRCFGGGGGGDGGGPGPGDNTGGGVGNNPDNGGPTSPITTMPPPAGQEEGPATLEILQDIIESPLGRFPSEGDIIMKNSALIAYLLETNQPVFQDLSLLLATNLYDTNLNVTDRTALWFKARSVYDIVKNNNPNGHTTFNMFFSSLDLQEQESYTKNTMETALFSSVKSIVGEFWPQNAQEWSVLFKLMGPLLLEIGIEFLPGGGVFNSGNDALAGLSSGDYTAAVVGVVGIIMEFVPWAKLAKIASKIYDVGKSAFKIFKVAYNFLGSIATAIEHGIKTVLDSSGILKLLDNSGNQVAKIVDGVMTVSKHGIKAVDGSVLFRSAGETNNLVKLQGYIDPPFIGNVVEFVTKESGQFVRFHDSGNQARSWIMKASDVQNLTESEIRNLFAIPVDNPIPLVSYVDIPAGTKLFNGKANGLYGFDGGGSQFFIDRVQFGGNDAFIPSSFFNPPIPISTFLN